MVDEGHRLKNFNSKLVRELRQLNVDSKLLLTGGSRLACHAQRHLIAACCCCYADSASSMAMLTQRLHVSVCSDLSRALKYLCTLFSSLPAAL